MREYDVHKETIVVDVDNVVVESGKRFAEWLMGRVLYVEACDSIGICPREQAFTQYDPISGLCLSRADEHKLFSWWNSRNLYLDMEPMTGSVDVLLALSDRYNIVFASHVEGEHGKSKVDFLKKYFPFMSGYAATRQKNTIRSSYNIDDRLIHLSNLPISTTPLLFESQWGNPEHIIQIVNWGTMLKHIK